MRSTDLNLAPHSHFQYRTRVLVAGNRRVCACGSFLPHTRQTKFLRRLALTVSLVGKWAARAVARRLSGRHCEQISLSITQEAVSATATGAVTPEPRYRTQKPPGGSLAKMVPDAAVLTFTW